MLGLNVKNVIALFGTGAIIATLLLIALSLIGGYLLGGPRADIEQVLSPGTGQRNLSAPSSSRPATLPTGRRCWSTWQRPDWWACPSCSRPQQNSASERSAGPPLVSLGLNELVVRRESIPQQR
jgi:hypothetical protein